jgi:FdhD protein
MGRQRTSKVMITRIAADGSTRRQPDRLIVEEPMTVQLDGTVVATTMRTPGHDFELAAGFCFTEGLLDGASVTGVRYCADRSALSSEFNVVTVETGGRAPVPERRLGVTSSSCGLCGRDQLDALTDRLAPFPPGDPPIPIDVLTGIPATVLGGQGLFGETGAVHAAAAFDATGDVIVTREDVGRHNAVDKVVGALLLDGRAPLGEPAGLFVSGRASIEMVQKAWATGFRALVAVSAPTALAVTAARRANLTLVGFVRPDGCNVYSPG